MSDRAKRIEKLIWEWRNGAAGLPSTSVARAMAFKCADDLERALASPPAPAEGEREVGGLTREGCDERGAIINALAYVLRTTYEIEEMSDEQRDIWRTLVARARREYDQLLAPAPSTERREPPAPPTDETKETQ